MKWHAQQCWNAAVAQYPLPANQNPVTALLGAADINDYPECMDLTNLLQTYYNLVILLNQAGAEPAPAPKSGDSYVRTRLLSRCNPLLFPKKLA